MTRICASALAVLTALLGLSARPAFAQSTDKNPLASVKSFKENR